MHPLYAFADQVHVHSFAAQKSSELTQLIADEAEWFMMPRCQLVAWHHCCPETG